MENNGKNDFIDVYVLKTLNEIKQKVKWAINLDKDKENETDKKMMLVLKDLINANFKNFKAIEYYLSQNLYFYYFHKFVLFLHFSANMLHQRFQHYLLAE